MPTTAIIQQLYDEKREKIIEWSNTQKGKNEFPAKVIKSIEETLINQLNLTADLERFKNILELLSTHKDTKPGEKSDIDKYLKDLNSLLAQIEELDKAVQILQDKETNPAKAIEALSQRYHTEIFPKMMSQLVVLKDKEPAINAICMPLITRLSSNARFQEKLTELNSSKAYDFRGIATMQTRPFGQFAGMPMQNIMRMQMPIEEIVLNLEKQLFKIIEKELLKLNVVIPEEIKLKNLMDLAKQKQLVIESIPGCSELQSLITLGKETAAVASSEAKIINLQQGANKAKELADKHIQSAKEEAGKIRSGINVPSAMLRQILRLNINTPTQSLTLENSEDFPHYLKKLLPKIHPTVFTLTAKGELSVSARGQTEAVYVNTLKAIGASLQSISLDPKTFDADALDSLYADKNLLWLVLKSTKPIDETFTPKQKIQTFISLAVAFKEEQLGGKGKSNEAYHLAKQAIALVKKYPELREMVNENFGPTSTIGKWIIDKQKDSEKDIVRGQLTIKAPVVQSEVASVTVVEPVSEVSSLRESSVSSRSSISDSDSIVSTEELPSAVDPLVVARRAAAISKLETRLDTERHSQLKDVIPERALIEIDKKIRLIEGQSSQFSLNIGRLKDKLHLAQIADQQSSPSTPKITGLELKAAISTIKELERTIQSLQQQLSQCESDLSQVDKERFDIHPLQTKIQELQAKLKGAETERMSFGQLLQKEEKLQTKKEIVFSSLCKSSANLKPADIQMLNEKIAGTKLAEELAPLNKNLRLLHKLDDHVKSVTDQMLKRYKTGGLSELFSSNPSKKIQNIKDTYNALTVDEKIQLAKLTEPEINRLADKNEQSPIGKFLQTLQQNRGLISVKETTSFKEFKGKIRDLSSEPAMEDLPDEGLNIQ